MKRDQAGRFSRAQSRPWQAQPQSQSGAGVGSALGLLAGAGVGAAIMFLMDPNQGPNRRQQILRGAEQALGSTTEALGSAWESARDHASHLSESLPSGSDLRDAASKHAGAAASSLRDGAGAAASHWRDSAGNWLESAQSRIPYRLQRKDSHDISATTAGIGGVAALATGLGAMWLLDPQRGRSRRAWLAQKTTRVLNETGQFMHATGRHMRNKVKGYSHEGRSAVSSAYSSAREAMAGSDAADSLAGSDKPRGAEASNI